MLDFEIDFLNQESFQFIDQSNLTDYTDLGTVDKTRLYVKYPLISASSEQELLLFDENIAALTDNFQFDTNDVLLDGVYSFRLDVLDSNPDSLGEITKYFIQDYSIQSCIKNQVEAALENEPKSWCDISRLRALLESAKFCASQGEWEKAQKIIDYIGNECSKLGCNC